MKQVSEWFRWLTPILVTVSLFLVSQINGSIKDVKTDLSSQIASLDVKVFKHLTNDEIHIPRGTVVTKQEFDLQCKFSTYQIDQIAKSLDQLHEELKKKR